MFLKDFYTTNDDRLLITAEQASRFAKDIAGDFNPLHDVDAKRFCVPGDLLFSLVLEKYGLSHTMHFTFSGMVGDRVPLYFPKTDAEQFEITDNSGKVYLQIQRSGAINHDIPMIDELIRDYVAFSGHNFPYVLVPLLAKQQVMFNVDRPMVIYDSMTLHFQHLNFKHPRLQTLPPEMEVNSKRATSRLHFQIQAGDEIVGSGFKNLTISGLRDYDAQVMDQFVASYLARKETYVFTQKPHQIACPA